jgi:hypothetical protein
MLFPSWDSMPMCLSNSQDDDSMPMCLSNELTT